MNERLKELMIQADYPAPEIAKRAHVLAELIVKECMNIIKQNENASLNIGNFTDEKKQGIQLGLEFAITDIAEHFGVEE
jgi:hypothetical protein